MSEQHYEPKSKLGKWFNDRLPLLTLANHLTDYPTPKNLNYWWTFGGILTFCLITQIVTGLVLAMHYIAHADMAFQSVEHIMRDVNYGWLIRYIHANGASMFFLAVYIHIFRSLFYGSYKSPREIIWIIGIIIDIGAGVSNVVVGDHVVMAPIAPCGQCNRCLNNEGAYCKREEERGWGVLPDGRTPLKDKQGEKIAVALNSAFFSDYAVVPSTAVAKIPKDVSFEIASLLGCAVVSGYGAVVNTAEVQVGSSILVVGLGGVGLSSVMAAKIRGAYPIIGVDPSNERRDLGKQIGCDEVLTVDEFNSIIS